MRGLGFDVLAPEEASSPPSFRLNAGSHCEGEEALPTLEAAASAS